MSAFRGEMGSKRSSEQETSEERESQRPRLSPDWEQSSSLFGGDENLDSLFGEDEVAEGELDLLFDEPEAAKTAQAPRASSSGLALPTGASRAATLGLALPTGAPRAVTSGLVLLPAAPEAASSRLVAPVMAPRARFGGRASRVRREGPVSVDVEATRATESPAPAEQPAAGRRKSRKGKEPTVATPAVIAAMRHQLPGKMDAAARFAATAARARASAVLPDQQQDQQQDQPQPQPQQQPPPRQQQDQQPQTDPLTKAERKARLAALHEARKAARDADTLRFGQLSEEEQSRRVAEQRRAAGEPEEHPDPFTSARELRRQRATARQREYRAAQAGRKE